MAASGECPTLSSYEDMFWQAYGNLTTERSIGMAAGPIPYSAMIRYARYNQLSQLQADIMMRVVRNMDNAWLMAVARKREVSNK